MSDALPPTETPSATSERRLAVKVTPDALRQIRGGSPWLFDGSITSISPGGAAGDLAVVFDDKRRFAGIGLFDPASPIRVKMLHHGGPRPIDAAFWNEKLGTAITRRESLASDGDTTGYRLVHGENDGFPGLVVDRYSATLVVKIYTEAWFAHLDAVIDALRTRLAGTVERIVVRLARNVRGPIADGTVVVGAAPTAPVRFRERGLELEADVIRGQKTGHFLDQRDNRQFVRGLAQGRTVLDVFASTGGFALAAAAGGATEVTLTDQSSPALETAKRNFAHNGHVREIRECRVSMLAGDAFEVMSRLATQERQFDLVIVDPPSFAQNQASRERALHAYGRLTEHALGVLAPKGTLVQCSCSSRVTADEFVETVQLAARYAGRSLRNVRRTGHPVDHPIGFEQGAYLKAIIATA